MAIRPQAVRAAPAAGSVPLNLMAIVVTMITLGLGLAYLIDGASRSLSEALVSTDQRVLSRTLGGKELHIPAGLFRYQQDLPEGFVERVELRIPHAAGGDSAAVDVTLLQRSKVRPSTQLLDGVYLHQFAPEQLSGPPGLVGKPLKDGAGYSSEIVWYDPLSGAPFVAKCLAAIEPNQPARCLRTVELSPTIAAVYSFDETLLPHWRDFDEAMTAQLGKIGVF